jgi:hypothetical protein
MISYLVECVLISFNKGPAMDAKLPRNNFPAALFAWLPVPLLVWLPSSESPVRKGKEETCVVDLSKTDGRRCTGELLKYRKARLSAYDEGLVGILGLVGEPTCGLAVCGGNRGSVLTANLIAPVPRKSLSLVPLAAPILSVLQAPLCAAQFACPAIPDLGELKGEDDSIPSSSMVYTENITEFMRHCHVSGRRRPQKFAIKINKDSDSEWTQTQKRLCKPFHFGIRVSSS